MPDRSLLVIFDEDYEEESDVRHAIESLDLDIHVRKVGVPDVGDPYAELAQLTNVEYIPGEPGSIYNVACRAVEKLREKNNAN